MTVQHEWAQFHSVDKVKPLTVTPWCLCIVPDEDHVVTEVAAELIRMADEFNRMMVSQAAERLTKKLNNSSPEVSRIYRGVGLNFIGCYICCCYRNIIHACINTSRKCVIANHVCASSVLKARIR